MATTVPVLMFTAMIDPTTHNHTLTIPTECDGMRLDQALARLLGQYSRSAIKHWIDGGRASLNGAPAKPRAQVRSGDRVTLTAILDATATLAPQDVEFEIEHVDDDLLVVIKPAGLVVHPGAGNHDRTLVNGLLLRYPELAALPRAGLIHRIDKDTSGLLLVARRPASYQRLIRAMAARQIRRHYETVVNGVLVAGATIDQPIGRDPRQRTRMRVTANGRRAITHYRVLERYRGHTLSAVRLETGRTHQIRVHMAWAGHPIVGDVRYGARPRPPPGATRRLIDVLESFPRQALHAARLELEHPASGDALAFEAPQPADFAELVAALADDAAHVDD